MELTLNLGYYDEYALAGAGFASLGHNVKIAKNCTIVGTENITIGSNVRIDGYCTLVAGVKNGIKLGSFIHIGSYCHFSGGSGIEVGNFSGISQGCCIYSQTDDFTGQYLTGPMVPEEFTGVIKGKVTLNRHVIIGSGSIVLPGVTIGEGVSLGAMSLVTNDLTEWGVYVGCPARRIKARSKKLLELERQFSSQPV